MKAHRHSLGHEHDFEPQRGLPEMLPADEQVLWQGGPDWQMLARRAFHVRKLAIYFAAILALRAGFVINDGGSLAQALKALAWLAPLAAIAVGGIAVMAWLSARGTLYTVTNKRVVMRIGIVLTVTFNLPYKRIEGAALHLNANGTGDLPLTLQQGERIAWLHLWPHVRPWRLARPEPMLRCVPEAQRVAQLLSTAWSQATGLKRVPAARPDTPQPVRVHQPLQPHHPVPAGD
jgi:hypothetical protein